MHTVYFGLGSNIGDRKANCLQALAELERNGIRIIRKSRMYETAPWGVTEQPSFINMAVEAETSLRPEELLLTIKEIEKKLGRTETTRWGPRVIDIDILLFDQEIIDTTIYDETGQPLPLVIPHPFIQEREFVLKPLAEIAPDLLHPVLVKTIKELIASLKT